MPSQQLNKLSIAQLNKAFTRREMKSILIAYNNHVRKEVYAGLGNKTKAQVVVLLHNDFKHFPKTNFHIQFKHKSGRFTKKIQVKPKRR